MADKIVRTDEEILAELPAAAQRGRQLAEAEPRARSARYDADSGRFEVYLTNGFMFSFPAEAAQGLQGATPEQLARVEVYPGGFGLHWEELDADLSVPGLMEGIFGTRAWMRELGRAGGRSRSQAKARASRENGKKGGRPRKAAGG